MKLLKKEWKRSVFSFILEWQKFRRIRCRRIFLVLQKHFFTSCIVLSDEDKILDNYLNEYIEYYLEKDTNCVDFAKLINTLCVKDEVMTAITGYNGSSINYFYFQDNLQ